MKPETARTLARLRSLLAKGKTLDQAGRTIRRSKSTVHRLAVRHRIARRRRRELPKQKDAAIRRRLAESRHTLRRIAELVRGVSYKSVWRRYQHMIDAGQEFRPKGIRAPRRCPRHGLVRVWPCVACAAEAAAGKGISSQRPPES
jgi:transcription initiation factor TFIIIB Brf1 subunit/transcription initiation factor TFIIB